MAEGLDCTLVYALVPNEPLDAVLRVRALAAADVQLKRTHHYMRLENQELDKSDLERETRTSRRRHSGGRSAPAMGCA